MEGEGWMRRDDKRNIGNIWRWVWEIVFKAWIITDSVVVEWV